MKIENPSTSYLTPSKVIKKLRTECGLSQLALSKLAGMSPAQLCKIERGSNDLTASTLRRISGALGVPVAVLLGEAVSFAPAQECSCVPSGNAGNVLYAPENADYIQVLRSPCGDESALSEIVAFEMSIAAEEDRLGISGQTAMQFVYSYGSDMKSAELLARDVRVSMGLGSHPRVDIDRVFENIGVNIVPVRRSAAFQSVAFFNSRRRTLSIALNKSNTAERNAYRLAYELGGVIRFASGGFGTVVDEGAVHIFLRAFAAAFLMPEEAVRGAVARLGLRTDTWTMSSLVYVKERFGVSAEAFALRLESLGLIAPSLRQRLRDELRAGYAAHPRAMEPHPPKNQTCLDIMKTVVADESMKEGVSR